mmetsp:Transcript_28515/g.60503  ORF Transcript_28515/g.60503 Transcript_28515/m.60503 type:complete len:277 (-) Transcript_28515:472-1302(-)
MISASALKAGDMYCRVRPFLKAAARANSLSARNSSDAYLYASGSFTTASRMNVRSPQSAFAAPLTAEPAPSLPVTWSTKAESPRRASAAPPSAAPLMPVTSATKSGSSVRAWSALANSLPVYFTASRISSLSLRSASSANFSAFPLLAIRAVRTSSRSARSSSGADSNNLQSIITAARHCASFQLLLVTTEIPAVRSWSCGTPSLLAARATPFKIIEVCARPSAASSRSPTGSPFFFLEAVYALHKASSSASGRSASMVKSFFSFEGLLLLNMRAA